MIPRAIMLTAATDPRRCMMVCNDWEPRQWSLCQKVVVQVVFGGWSATAPLSVVAAGMGGGGGDGLEVSEQYMLMCFDNS